MKRWVAVGILFLSLKSSSQNISQQLDIAISRLQSDLQFKHSIISLYVVDKKGAVMFDKNSDIGLAPASCQKVITAASAFELLGKDYSFKTSLGYTGNINNGNLKFETKRLPLAAQLTPFKDAVIVNANNDNLPDIFIGGNFYDNNIEMGRYDADFGTILINKGKGDFICETLNGIQIKGQIRHIKPIQIGKQQAFIVARNSDSAMVIKFKN